MSSITIIVQFPQKHFRVLSKVKRKVMEHRDLTSMMTWVILYLQYSFFVASSCNTTWISIFRVKAMEIWGLVVPGKLSFNKLTGKKEGKKLNVNEIIIIPGTVFMLIER